MSPHSNLIGEDKNIRQFYLQSKTILICLRNSILAPDVMIKILEIDQGRVGEGGGGAVTKLYVNGIIQN